MFQTDNKDWKIERSIVPIQSGGMTFEVETDVRWCSDTGEIHYRKPEGGGIFESEWEELSEYSDLYKKLRENFLNKYERREQPSNRMNWTQASKFQ